MKGIDVIKEYRKGIHPWFYMIDHIYKVFEERNEFGDVNIGFNAGLLGNVPYFAECWATNGFTILTVFISYAGYEKKEDSITDDLVKDGLFKLKPGYYKPQIQVINDSHNRFFYSYNIIVGDEENTYLDDLLIYPFSILNKINTKW